VRELSSDKLTFGEELRESRRGSGAKTGISFGYSDITDSKSVTVQGQLVQQGNRRSVTVGEVYECISVE
jgi:hypothetical protein